jgi:hypothetical protein
VNYGHPAGSAHDTTCAGGSAGASGNCVSSSCTYDGGTVTTNRAYYNYAGGIVGQLQYSATVGGDALDKACRAYGNISTGDTTNANSVNCAGGIVGLIYSAGGTVGYCFYAGSVSVTCGAGNNFAGGIAGSNGDNIGSGGSGGAIHDCTAAGTITATGATTANYAGGVTGYSGNLGVDTTAFIEHCNVGVAEGTVIGGTAIFSAIATITAGKASQLANTQSNYAGGIVGSNGDSITGSSSGGKVNGCTVTGDVVTVTATDCSYAGGIAGINYASGGSIEDCRYGVGTVSSGTASTSCAGGIAGYNYSGMISACANNGGSVIAKSITISSLNCAGGIAGLNYTLSGIGTATITNCCATAAVAEGTTSATITAGDDASTAHNFAGGIVGYNQGDSIDNRGVTSYCYATNTVIAIGINGYSGGITGANDTYGALEYCVALNQRIPQTSYTHRVAGESRGSITGCYGKGIPSGFPPLTFNLVGANVSAGTNGYNDLAWWESTAGWIGAIGINVNIGSVTSPWKWNYTARVPGDIPTDVGLPCLWWE